MALPSVGEPDSCVSHVLDVLRSYLSRHFALMSLLSLAILARPWFRR
jgi:hypothetical protein